MKVLDETPAISLASHNKQVILDAIEEVSALHVMDENDGDCIEVCFADDLRRYAETKYGEGK